MYYIFLKKSGHLGQTCACVQFHLSILEITTQPLYDQIFVAFLMNRLVFFLEEHHGTQDRLYNFTRVGIIMEETGWSRGEILRMALEADDAGELVATFSFKSNKWKVEAVAEDLMTVGTIRSSWKQQHKKNALAGSIASSQGT